MKVFIRVSRQLRLQDRWFIVMSFVLRIILVSFDLVGIFLVGVVVSLVSGTIISDSSNLGKFLSWLDSYGDYQGYVVLAGASVCFFILKAIFAIQITSQTNRKMAIIETNLAVEMYDKFLNSDLEIRESLKDQEILNSLNKGVNSAFSQTVNSFAIVFAEFSLLIAIAIYLAMTNFIMFLVIASFYIIVGASLNKWLANRTAKSSEISHFSVLDSQGNILDALSNLKQIASTDRVDFFTNRFKLFRSVYSRESAKYSTMITLPRYVTEIAVMLGVVILVFQRSSDSLFALSAPEIAIFLAGIFRIVASMLPLQSALSNLKNTYPEALSTLNFQAQVQGNGTRKSYSEACEFHDVCPIICVRELKYRYPRSLNDALSGVDLTVHKGQFIAIVGKSGAGKSTLADLLLGLRTPTYGSIRISGIETTDPRFRKKIATSYIPQTTKLVSGSIRQNITLLEDTSPSNEAQLSKVIEMANLRELVDSLPEGLDTVLGQGQHALSGGEIQRVGIARALFNEPDLIVMDEATSSLDSESELAINNTIVRLKGATTIIAIAHRRATIDLADVKFEMKNLHLTQI